MLRDSTDSVQVPPMIIFREVKRSCHNKEYVIVWDFVHFSIQYRMFYFTPYENLLDYRCHICMPIPYLTSYLMIDIASYN